MRTDDLRDRLAEIASAARQMARETWEIHELLRRMKSPRAKTSASFLCHISARMQALDARLMALREECRE